MDELQHHDAKPSAAHHHHNHHRVARERPRRRLQTACYQCRVQKIRCVRLNDQRRCVNCNMGDKPCTLMSNSGSFRPPSYPPTVHEPVSQAAVSEAAPSQASTGQASAGHRRSLGPAKTYGLEPASNTALEELVQSPRGLTDDHFNHLILEALSPSQAPGSPTTTDQTDEGDLLPHVASMHPRDVKFLNYQGCFTIPDQHALELFFRQYFLHIHPLFPIIDEVHFWGLHRSNSTADLILGGQLSLLLLYGILYTSASYVPTSLVQGLGFHNIHQAKGVFHTRAKLLYESRFERSAIAISQAALLLSHCYLTQPPQTLNNMAPMWLAIAVQHAKQAGAPEYNTVSLAAQPNTPENNRHRQTLKRLWWTCIIRDRIMPLAARQAVRITRSVFDFESNPPLSASDFSQEIESSPTYDRNAKFSLVIVLEKLVELCVILTDVLAVDYTPGKDDVHTAIQQAGQASRIRDCRAAMQAWYTSFMSLRLHDRVKPVSAAELNGSSDAFVVLFANVVAMYYHSANVALCHQEMLIFGPCSPSVGLDSTPTEDALNREQVQTATAEMVQCLTNLTRLRLAHLLPLSVVGVSMLPLALQIVDLKLLSSGGQHSERDPQSALLKQRQTRFIGVIEAMQMCRPRFPAVDWVLTCIRISVESFYRLLFSNASAWNMTNRLLPSSKSWTDILRQQPNFYLSLATLMDFSLSNGRLPGASDLPTRLKTMECPKQIGSNTFHYGVLPESFSLGDIDILTRVQVHFDNLYNRPDEPMDVSEIQSGETTPRVVEMEDSPEEDDDGDYTMQSTPTAQSLVPQTELPVPPTEAQKRDTEAEHEAYLFGQWIDEVTIF